MSWEPNLYCYGARDDDPHAIKLVVTDEDREAFDNLPPGNTGESVEVTDGYSGLTFDVQRANCGAGCYCAAKASLVESSAAWA